MLTICTVVPLEYSIFLFNEPAQIVGETLLEVAHFEYLSPSQSGNKCNVFEDDTEVQQACMG